MLIADPDVSLSNTLSTLAQRYGHRVVSVDNGRDLLAQIDGTAADLCAVEILLPDGDGLEVIPEIRRSYPQVKIIAMCEGGIFGRDAAPLFLRMAQSLGADRTLAKPFVLVEFLKAVHELLGVTFRSQPYHSSDSPTA